MEATIKKNISEAFQIKRVVSNNLTKKFILRFSDFIFRVHIIIQHSPSIIFKLLN